MSVCAPLPLLQSRRVWCLDVRDRWDPRGEASSGLLPPLSSLPAYKAPNRCPLPSMAGLLGLSRLAMADASATTLGSFPLALEPYMSEYVLAGIQM